MNRWFAGITAVVFAIAVWPLSRPGAGWFWEFGNGLGLAALAALLYLCLDTRRGGKVHAHQQIGYVACVLLVSHALWFLIGDTTLLQYAQPGAPWSMWSAWLALLILLVLVVTSLPALRPANYSDHPAFRFWHRGLTLVVLAAAAHHVIDTAFYLSQPAQWLLLLILFAAALWLPMRRSGGLRGVNLFLALLVFSAAIAAFTALKWLPQ
ncbi:MAG: ferric reductase-like transmembrane domain-containing protein [Halieaceae bacterium]